MSISWMLIYPSYQKVLDKGVSFMFIRQRRMASGTRSIHWEKNRLNTMLKSACKAGIEKENITNHSLCATGTTNLFEAGVPEHIIKKCTGHSSLDALQKYERVRTGKDGWMVDGWWKDGKDLTEGSSWEQKTSKANGPTGVTMNDCKDVFVKNTDPLSTPWPTIKMTPLTLS